MLRNPTQSRASSAGDARRAMPPPGRMTCDCASRRDGALMARLGDQMAALLKARGFDAAFAAPSSRVVGLLGGAEGAGLRAVAARGEQGAGFMAEGYARATGKPALCMIGGGAGLSGLCTALAQAQASATPMLTIATAPPDAHACDALSHADEFADGCALARPLVGLARRVETAEEAPDALDAALATITAEQPGPAYLEFPRALLDAEAPPLDYPPRPLPAPPAPAAAEIAETIMRLSSARRPVLILGGGATGMGGTRAIRLAEALNAPTILTSDAAGLLPPGHPLRLGGPLDAPAFKELLLAADCVLALGARFDAAEWGPGGARGPRFKDDALIRIGLSRAPLSPALNVALEIVGDPALGAQTLIDNLPENAAPPQDLHDLRARISAHAPARLTRHLPLIEAVWDILPDAVLIGDDCEPAQTAMHGAAPPAARRWWSAASALGPQGYALPAAIGAKIGSRRPVVALVGDVGAMGSIGELASAVQAEAHVLALVWNNSGADALRARLQARGAPTGLADLPPIDFQALARGFGAAYGRVHGLAYFHEAVKKATARPCTTVLELREEFWFES